MDMVEILIVSFGITAFSFLSWGFGLLKISGAIAASLVGLLIFLGMGWQGLVLLGFFFLTSSLWSKWKEENKKAVEQIVEKGNQRDWSQVIANGGVPALFSLLYFLKPEPVFLYAFAAALASSNADTWASELGVLSKKEPIQLFPVKRVAKGTSGAVSPFGTTAGFFGSVTIAVFSRLYGTQKYPFRDNPYCYSRICRNVHDSLLGRTVRPVSLSGLPQGD